MLSSYCIGSPQGTTKTTLPQYSMLQHQWQNINFSPSKPLSGKNPKNPQAKTPTKNSQLIHQKSLAKTPQKSHLNAVKMTTNLYNISPQSGRPKLPYKKPQVTR